SQVQQFNSVSKLVGANGSYPTDGSHDLTVGARSSTLISPFNGRMVDEAIFNRALSTSEIQKLFDYKKVPVATVIHQPTVTGATTNENMQTSSGLVVGRNAL